MKAMVLPRSVRLADHPTPLELREVSDPVPSPGEVLVRVTACGVCHTDLDEIEGRLPPADFPMILGHQVVGRIVAVAGDAGPLAVDDRVGIAWINSACGDCPSCRSGQENLCPAFKATGKDVPGGYAEYVTAPAAFVHPLPPGLDDTQTAPLLCAGAIGYRALRLTSLADGQVLGLYGFGASNHLVLKMVRHLFPAARIHAFARNAAERAFALELGAVWAGEITATPPEQLDGAIDTTPAWLPVTQALRHLRPGARLVVNAIRKEETDKDALLALDYERQLWQEKEIKSVANITREDVRDFLALAEAVPLRPEVHIYPLAQANDALADLQAGRIRGAKVLLIDAR